MKHFVFFASTLLSTAIFSSSSAYEEATVPSNDPLIYTSDEFESKLPPILRNVKVRAVITRMDVTIDPVTGPDFRHTEICRIETSIHLYDVNPPFTGMIPNTEVLKCPTEYSGAPVELKLIVDASSHNTDQFPFVEGKGRRVYGAYLGTDNLHPYDSPLPWVGNRVFVVDDGPTIAGFEVSPDYEITCTGEGRDQTCYPSQPVYFTATVLVEDQGQ